VTTHTLPPTPCSASGTVALSLPEEAGTTAIGHEMSGRQSKVEKEREKALQDRVQVVLSGMLKDDDNKYCVDCDNKGPRWASWNLGIFLCIRCAGIHRNLGVHISKVKSVNLDSWTLQQVSSMQQMGNCKARAVYEANLPEDFRRPQTDSAVEAFVRQKYEKKKFVLANWEPSKPPEIPVGWTDSEDVAVTKAKTDVAKKVVLPARSPTAPVTSRPVAPKPAEPCRPITAPALPASASADLLGLMSPPHPTPVVPSPRPAIPPSASSDLLGLQAEFGDFTSASSAVPQTQASSNAELLGATVTATPATTETGKMSRDSIMALFGPQSSQAPMFSSPQPPPFQSTGVQYGNLAMFGSGNPSYPGLSQQQQQQSVVASNNPFLADTGLLGNQLGNLNLGQGQQQASLWQ